ncbi:MAG: 50S ribosomal protein L25 [Candidatus Levyibacteriota bacterium]
MKRQKLVVEKRKITGKQLKKLRREGILPANIYGKAVKSLSVQVAVKDFEKAFKEVGQTGLLDLEVGTETRPVLIHNVQVDSLSRLPIHADFYQVNLKEKVKTMVSIVVVGEPKAVSEKVGLLLQPLSEIEVEALPEDLPENIEVNVESLAAVDQQLTVADLKLPKDIEVLTDPAQVVVKIAELVTKEAAEEAAKAEAEAEAAKAEAAAEAPPVEGAQAEEGAPKEEAETAETKPEAQKPAEKPQETPTK